MVDYFGEGDFAKIIAVDGDEPHIETLRNLNRRANELRTQICFSEFFLQWHDCDFPRPWPLLLLYNSYIKVSQFSLHLLFSFIYLFVRENNSSAVVQICLPVLALRLHAFLYFVKSKTKCMLQLIKKKKRVVGWGVECNTAFLYTYAWAMVGFHRKKRLPVYLLKSAKIIFM